MRRKMTLFSSDEYFRGHRHAVMSFLNVIINLKMNKQAKKDKAKKIGKKGKHQVIGQEGGKKTA